MVTVVRSGRLELKNVLIIFIHMIHIIEFFFIKTTYMYMYMDTAHSHGYEGSFSWLTKLHLLL